MFHLNHSKFMAQNKVLIFVHIPKTAGTTLRRIIERQFLTDQIYSIDPEEQRQINQLRQLPELEKARIRCLKGHMPFGLHRMLSQSPVYMTVLRHPVERMISNYYFMQKLGKEIPFLATYVRGSLEKFIDFLSERNEVNLQTRLLSGIIDLNHVRPPYAPLPEEALDIAKRNLADKFKVVGLTERFDETLMLMKQALGFRNVFYSKLNVTRRRPAKAQLNAQILNLIERVEHMDMSLYRFAEELFEMRINKQGTSFKRKVRVFSMLNRLYGPTAKAYHRLKRNSPLKARDSRFETGVHPESIASAP